MEDFNLSNTLSPGTITFEEVNERSTIDLCLITTGLVDRVISSDVSRDLDHNSDHLPISTVLDMTVHRESQISWRNHKRLKLKVYIRSLKDQLPPLRRPATKRALDNYVHEIVKAIKQAIDDATP